MNFNRILVNQLINKKLKKNINNQAFTLIELLVVIAIIGLLSAVVLANIQEARRKANRSRLLGDINTVTIALELYHRKYGVYPPSNDVGVTNLGDTIDDYLLEFMPPLNYYDYSDELYTEKFGNLGNLIGVDLIGPIIYKNGSGVSGTGEIITCGGVSIFDLPYYLFLWVEGGKPAFNGVSPILENGSVITNGGGNPYCFPPKI